MLPKLVGEDSLEEGCCGDVAPKTYFFDLTPKEYHMHYALR